MNLTRWSKRVGIKPGTLYARRKKGWSPKRILTTPVAPNGKIVASKIKSHAECVPRKIPQSGSHLVRFVLHQMKQRRISYKEMSKKSGVAVDTLIRMRNRGIGLINNIEALINVLGFNLLPVPKGDERYTDIYGQVPK